MFGGQITMEHISGSITSMNNEKTRKSLTMNNDIARADRIADWLAEKLDSPRSREYYCKVAYNLAESKIQELLEIAVEKGRHPAKYFSYLTKREIRRTNRGQNTQ